MRQLPGCETRCNLPQYLCGLEGLQHGPRPGMVHHSVASALSHLLLSTDRCRFFQPAGAWWSCGIAARPHQNTCGASVVQQSCRPNQIGTYREQRAESNNMMLTQYPLLPITSNSIRACFGLNKCMPVRLLIRHLYRHYIHSTTGHWTGASSFAPASLCLIGALRLWMSCRKRFQMRSWTGNIVS